MSDSEAPGGSPDFLDRLLARHTAPRPAAARVRPRLPGPFERVEAVRAAAPAPDDDTLLWPAAAPPHGPAAGCAERRRPWRHGHTRNGSGPSYTRSGRPSRRGRVLLLRPAPRRRRRVPPPPSRGRCGRRPTAGGVRRCARSGNRHRPRCPCPSPRAGTSLPTPCRLRCPQRRRHGGNARSRTAGRGPATGTRHRAGGAGADRAARSDGGRGARRRTAPDPRRGEDRGHPEPRGIPGAGARVNREHGSARRPAGREEPRN